MEGNLAARSQAVRGVTLRLLCACAQPPVPQQKSSDIDGSLPSAEPQRLSSIFTGLAQIESQVCGLPQGSHNLAFACYRVRWLRTTGQTNEAMTCVCYAGVQP